VRLDQLDTRQLHYGPEAAAIFGGNFDAEEPGTLFVQVQRATAESSSS
jgi:hypothetical protein